MCLPIVSLSVVSSFPVFQDFLITSFLFREFPLAIILGMVCRWQFLLVFPHLRTLWFSHWMQNSQSTALFFFSPQKKQYHFLCSPWFLLRNLSFTLFFPIREMSFAAFKISSLMLVFINLLSVLVWISLGLSFLWYTQFLVGMYLLFTGSHLSPQLRNFQPSLLPALFTPLFQQYQKHNIRTFLL